MPMRRFPPAIEVIFAVLAGGPSSDCGEGDRAVAPPSRCRIEDPAAGIAGAPAGAAAKGLEAPTGAGIIPPDRLADWAKLLSSERGKGPGPGGFQEIDLDVRATTLRKGNLNYRGQGVPESESLGGARLPPSLYRASKPEWFGDLAWPPFGPDVDFERNRIPAQVRFEAERDGAPSGSCR